MNRAQIIETMARAAGSAYLSATQDPLSVLMSQSEFFDDAASAEEMRAGIEGACVEVATAALTALEAAGMVVVPREPSEAMMRAGGIEHRNNPVSSIPSVYTAMIAAAQEKPE